MKAGDNISITVIFDASISESSHLKSVKGNNFRELGDEKPSKTYICQVTPCKTQDFEGCILESSH